jgi:S-adenosyl-L-methionine hydrolase (adenosine-forming)
VPSAARRRTGRRLVTLSSDLGSAYAAQMKAVLARASLAGQLVDLSHDLRPHDVREAAFVVRAMAERFPAGSVHVVVVDPGVGGARAPVAVACRDGSVVIGPDNGVLVPLTEALGCGTAYRLDPDRLRAAPRVGTTFDGRDVFAPAAARIASGVAPSRLGSPTRLHPAREVPPRRTERGADGSVVHIDRFGNVVTDVPSRWVDRRSLAVDLRLGRTVRRLPLVASYEEAGRGRLVVLGSSFGSLEVALARGRAADRLRVRVGARVRFAWRGRARRPVRRNGK